MLKKTFKKEITRYESLMDSLDMRSNWTMPAIHPKLYMKLEHSYRISMKLYAHQALFFLKLRSMFEQGYPFNGVFIRADFSLPAESILGCSLFHRPIHESNLLQNIFTRKIPKINFFIAGTEELGYFDPFVFKPSLRIQSISITLAQYMSELSFIEEIDYQPLIDYDKALAQLLKSKAFTSEYLII